MKLKIKPNSVLKSLWLLENYFRLIVGSLIEKFISNDTYKNKILDGYPRTLKRKNLYLLNKFNQQIDLVLKLSVSLETKKKN